MSHRLSRRQLIVASAAGIAGAHPLYRSLAGAAAAAAAAPATDSPRSGIPAFYTTDPDLAPWSKSPAELEAFLSTEHPLYDLDGWFFFGSLVERSGRKSAFLMAVQRIEVTYDGVPVPFFPAAVAYHNPSLGRYLVGGSRDIDVWPYVTVTQDPWKLTVVNAPWDPAGTMSMELQSGQMGQAGATYVLNAAVTDQFGELLVAKVTLRDRMGAVNEGYGPGSFYPQWITPLQRSQIRSEYGGSVRSYLRHTADPMWGQGSYYYSLGLMDVVDFQIDVASPGSPVFSSSGTRGTFWMDYVVESYDKTAQSVIAKASWQFFALQFPSRGMAMMINRLDTAAGRLNIARLYKEGDATTPNGALRAHTQWDSDKIAIKPIRGTNWTSKYSGQTYPMAYRITLSGGSKVGNGDLVLRTLRNNQEIVVGDTVKYEGLMTVEGTLSGKPIRGQAWAELQPVGHL